MTSPRSSRPTGPDRARAMLRRIAAAALTMAALAGPADPAWAAESVERLR